MAMVTLNTTLGATLIGLEISAILLGFGILQAWYYFTHQNDGWRLKVLVGTVITLDLVHQALITHTVYTYTITDFGDLAALHNIVWSNSVQVIFTALIAFLVQSFLAVRVCRFSNHNKLLTGVVALLVVGEFVAIITSAAISFGLKRYTDLKNVEYLPILVNALAVAGDVLITISLCVLLQRSRTGLRRSEAVINRLMLFAINTGLITSIFVVASLITIVAAPRTLIFVAIFFCISKVYTNTLLANLNAREKIQNMGYAGNQDFVLTGGFPESTTLGTGVPATIPIRVDTTNRLTRDDHLDDGRDSEKLETANSSNSGAEEKASVAPPLP